MQVPRLILASFLLAACVGAAASSHAVAPFEPEFPELAIPDAPVPPAPDAGDGFGFAPFDIHPDRVSFRLVESIPFRYIVILVDGQDYYSMMAGSVFNVRESARDQLRRLEAQLAEAKRANRKIRVGETKYGRSVVHARTVQISETAIHDYERMLGELRFLRSKLR